MSRYLIQVTIGPVQDFIASARKLRDLWFGSNLLSELSKTVARSLKEQGGDLIFPFAASDDDLKIDSSLIVANKILVEFDEDISPAQVLEKTKTAWIDHRNVFAEKTLKKILEIKGININRELYKKQVLDSGEFFAAWVTLTDDYKFSKAKLEKLLAGRKNLREFNAPAWDGTGIPKNSLDGIREAVTGDEQQEIVGLLKKNEKLDTLGCIKRFYPITSGHQKKKFDDLSSIAILPWLKGLEEMNQTLILKFLSNFIGQEYLQNNLGTIKPENHAQYFYLEKNDLKKFGAVDDYKKLKFIIRNEPQKYACILVGDGDNMGKTLDLIETARGHRTFTRHLGDFANKIGKTIEQYQGSLIYAGGDDVMAYLPLHTIIACAEAIRKKFSAAMQTIYSELNLPGTCPTFSIGVAVVHHSSPLDQALNKARKAESIAKEEGGRNALAIIQSKRGGADLCVYDKWEYPDKEGIISRFQSICTLYEDKKLPATLGYQLRQASIDAGDNLKFKLSLDAKNLVPLNAASALLIRIFDQKEHSQSLKKLLLNQTSIRKLSDELVVALQLAKAENMSKGGKNW